MWRRRALVLALAAALTALPLVGSLGYEHAFVLAPILALVAMAVGVDALRSLAGTPEASWWALGIAVARELVTLHGLVIGMTLLGGLWQRGCDPLGGLLFYGMGPGLSSVLGAVCGVIAATFIRRRVLAILLAFLPMASCIVVGLWRLYADPVVFAYDPFFGYYSGAIYDEGVHVGGRYLRYRGYTLLAASAALGMLVVVTDHRLQRRARPLADLRTDARGPRGALALMSGLAAIASIAIGLRGSHHGFTADEESIRDVLSQRIETEHFIIDYAPRSPEDRMIALIAAEHEYAYHLLQEKMDGRAPPGKVHSFVFRDPNQKREAMGAGTVQVAAPWRQQIYLDHRDYPHPVLHHELAHVFGKTVGDDLFGVARSGLHVNIGLIEGFATGLAPRPVDRLDVHDQVEVLEALGRRPKLAEIMGPGFFGHSSRVAYMTVGSFVQWLLEQRGFEPLGTFYRTAGDAQAAYGTSLEELEAQWLAFLDARDGHSAAGRSSAGPAVRARQRVRATVCAQGRGRAGGAAQRHDPRTVRRGRGAPRAAVRARAPRPGASTRPGRRTDGRAGCPRRARDPRRPGRHAGPDRQRARAHARAAWRRAPVCRGARRGP